LKYRPPGRRLRHRVHPPSLQAGRSAGFPLLAGAPRRHRVAEASPSRSLAAARVHRDAPLHPRQVRSPAIHRLSVAGALPSCCAPCVARRSAARGSSTHATLAMGVASAPTARAARTAAGRQRRACAEAEAVATRHELRSPGSRGLVGSWLLQLACIRRGGSLARQQIGGGTIAELRRSPPSPPAAARVALCSRAPRGPAVRALRQQTIWPAHLPSDG